MWNFFMQEFKKSLHVGDSQICIYFLKESMHALMLNTKLVYRVLIVIMSLK